MIISKIRNMIKNMIKTIILINITTKMIIKNPTTKVTIKIIKTDQEKGAENMNHEERVTAKEKEESIQVATIKSMIVDIPIMVKITLKENINLRIKWIRKKKFKNQKLKRKFFLKMFLDA